MHKIADADELERELRRLLAYSQSERPSRTRMANELNALSIRVAGERLVNQRTAGASTLSLLETAKTRVYKLYWEVINQQNSFETILTKLKAQQRDYVDVFERLVMDKVQSAIHELELAHEGAKKLLTHNLESNGEPPTEFR